MGMVILDEKASGAVNNNDYNHTPRFSFGSDRFVALRPSKVINRKLSCSNLLTNLPVPPHKSSRPAILRYGDTSRPQQSYYRDLAEASS